MRSLAFLGHIIYSEGVEVDPTKMKTVKNRPLTPADIRIFLGLVGYYWRFVDGFSSIVYPLTTLTQKSKKFEWSGPCERNFQIWKDRLTFASELTLPEDTKGFVVYCDASRVGLGCMLMQHVKVIAYCFKAT